MPQNLIHAIDVGALSDALGELLAAGDFAPPRCETLAERTWEKNVAPMVAAVEALGSKSRRWQDGIAISGGPLRCWFLRA